MFIDPATGRALDLESTTIMMDKYSSDTQWRDLVNGPLKEHLLSGWKLGSIDRTSLKDKIRLVLQRTVVVEDPEEIESEIDNE